MKKLLISLSLITLIGVLFVIFFTTGSCKKEGQSVCINSLICPNNKDKSCEGLYAVIDSKSYAVCEKPSLENEGKPRVDSLEQ